jgi:RimJ/RimL family protein N-acetyltransferase
VSFDFEPHLQGQLVELRPLVAEDWSELYAVASDPLIWEQHPEPDRYTRPVFQRYFDGGIESGGAFVAVDRKTGHIIGSSRYHDFKPEESQIEIGFTFLERKYWGGEYNGEMKRLMLDHAFRFVKRVVFVVGENNQRSQKAVEKIGGKFLSMVDRPGSNGTVKKNVIFGIDRGAYQSARGIHEIGERKA